MSGPVIKGLNIHNVVDFDRTGSRLPSNASQEHDTNSEMPMT